MLQNICNKNKKVAHETNYVNLSKEELIAKLNESETKYKTLQENPQNVSNIIVFPNAFGKEDIDHIRKKIGDIVGPLIKNQTFTSIPSLFNKIHNCEQLPEYHNVYSASERSSFALVSDGKTFKYRPKKTIIDQIIEDKRSILNDYVDNNGEQLGEKVLKKYEKYQDQLDTDPQIRKELELEIAGLLLDMKSVIANDDRTRQLLDKVIDGNFELTTNVESAPNVIE
jgi:hypothetical protein